MDIERVPIEKWYPIAYEDKGVYPPPPSPPPGDASFFMLYVIHCYIFHVLKYLILSTVFDSSNGSWKRFLR